MDHTWAIYEEIQNSGREWDDMIMSADGTTWVGWWRLNNGQYLIVLSNNAESIPSILDHEPTLDDVDDMLLFGIDDLQWPENLECLANMVGIDHIALECLANMVGINHIAKTSTNDDHGPFAILRTRYYYGPFQSTSIIRDERGKMLIFDTYKDAERWIRDIEGREYILSHNESGRPSYTIV